VGAKEGIVTDDVLDFPVCQKAYPHPRSECFDPDDARLLDPDQVHDAVIFDDEET
jgi:hypothetical protein